MNRKKIFEYWSHAASFLPMEHYRYCLPRMRQYREGKSHWFKADKKLIDHVMTRIKNEGPLRSADFESPKKSGGWFEWKPAKKALEQLFMAGILMVKERKGFHKLYDLAENVLPKDIDSSMPSDEEWADFFIPHRLQSLGLATLDEISYQRGPKAKLKTEARLKEWVAAKKVVAVTLPERKKTCYALAKTLAQLPATKIKQEFHLLSPFDNSVIQRRPLKELFGFDYQIECYVPEEKRRYGYFCLPILKGDQFVGRIDAKADRGKKELIIKKLFWEKGVVLTPTEHRAFQNKLQSFAEFNRCPTILTQ